jgi:hypothetical protein
MKKYALLLIALLLAGCTGYGSKDSANEVADYAVFRAKEIRIDGSLDEECWRNAHFIALRKTIAEDASGNPAAQRTEVALLYEPDTLYIGWNVWDNDIIAAFTQQDEPLYEQDVVEAFIDANGNLHDYAEFELSPNNVLFDGWATKKDWKIRPAKIDAKGWDSPGVQTAVKRNGDFWSAEIRIPIAELRNREPTQDEPITPGEIWKLNLFRIDYTAREPEIRKDDTGKETTRYKVVELQSWGVFPKGWFHQPAYFRSIQFVK